MKYMLLIYDNEKMWPAMDEKERETIEALLQTADRELYRMKRRGVGQASLLAAV